MANGTDLAKELENYRKLCFELEEKGKKDELRCLMLETEVRDLKKRNEELEGEIARVRKVGSDGEKGKGMVVDLTDEDDEGDKFVQLLIENNVLECEKARGEVEIRSLKEKVRELVSRVCELERKANVKGVNESSSVGVDVGMVETGKTHLDTDTVLKERVIENVDVVSKNENIVEGGDRGCNQVRKRLSFEEDGCPNKKMAPSTPGVAQHPFSGVIDISDEDEAYNEAPNVEKLNDSATGSSPKTPSSSKNNPERTNLERINEDDVDGFQGYTQTPACGKRKRTNIITSDDEKSNDDEEIDGFSGHSSKTASAKRRTRAARIVASDDDDDDDDTSVDDNAPICTLIKQRSPMVNIDSEDEVKENVGRRHLRRLRNPGSKNRQNRSSVDVNETVNLHGYSSSEDEEENDGVDKGSESEGESLGGFIVESSESCSEIAPVSDDSSDESEDALSDFKSTLDKIGRKKVSNQKWKWDLEGDMLAAFGKDAELCMRAVCALYRQQTEDEKACKGTLHHNARGFSQCDAPRASEVAEFLMDGDSSGDMNKTVEELEQHNSKGIKLCMALAVKYSKQLFEIYQNKEDPYFLP
ncbi:hypothetical protein OSB04_025464 [Centaurea solstitialis]|uniref:Uncharacterized protein n=1 Tax=Centaurea solstitialis TaxID=347529 RepID=A0AA38T6K8_9ASTR|nr:hypothetical protein OSB04_025464 [Centaurea solstitialis]